MNQSNNDAFTVILRNQLFACHTVPRVQKEPTTTVEKNNTALRCDAVKGRI